MKILICSHDYPPDITPVAFRAEALVQEFLRRGFFVDLFIPGSKVTEWRNPNLRVVPVGEVAWHKSAPEKTFKNMVRTLLGVERVGRLKKYLFYSRSHYGRELTATLRAKADSEYDLVLSIGVPLLVHEGVRDFLKQGICQCGCTVADCSDPVYAGGDDTYAPWIYLREKRALEIFDYVTVRLEAAKPAFVHYKAQEQIKVISQGYNFGQIQLSDYQKNAVPTFAYAGRFYDHIRNPYQFFGYLQNLSHDFMCYLYLDKKSQRIVEPYLSGIRDKVKVRDFLARDALLPELGKMDFLINFVNAGRPCQLPSKVIDYAFTGRPILNLSCEKFESVAFDSFLKGRYEDALQVDWRSHDIGKIAEQFLALLKQ